jgi:hypothetical protein
VKFFHLFLLLWVPWAGWAADLPADVDLGIPYQKEALANSLRCLETIRGDEYRKALTRIWVAENLGYVGDQQRAVQILGQSDPHYLIPYGCVETALVLLGHGQNQAVRQLISLGLDFLTYTVGKGGELVQFQILKLATVVGDQESVARAWAAESLLQVSLKPAYEAFVQDWRPSFANRLRDWWQPGRHWLDLNKDASRDQEITWTSERAVDVFTAILLIKEAESRVRRGQSYPGHWISFAGAGVNSAAINTRPAAIQAGLAELAALEGRAGEARNLVFRAGKMLAPWAPQMAGLYKIERDLALVLASLPDSGEARAQWIDRMTQRVESLMGQTVSSYEQMLHLPFLAEAFQALGKPDKAQATWKTAAELCAQNQNPESQSIGLTRIWMSYARANTWPDKDTEALLAKIEKKLPEEYAKVNF